MELERTNEKDHVDLLISLLIRFPQIGTVHYDPVDNALRLVFLLRGKPLDFEKFSLSFQNHLTLFHSLQRLEVGLIIPKKIENASLTALEIQRGLEDLSLRELNLMVQLINGCYGALLVREGLEMEEDEAFEQNSLIEFLLYNAPKNSVERLTGFRENGRVLVFSQPPLGVSGS